MDEIPDVETAGKWILRLYKRYKKAVESLGCDCDWDDFKWEVERIVEEAEEEAGV